MRAETERSAREAASDGSSQNGHEAGLASTFAAHAAEIAEQVSRLARVRAARFRLRAGQTVLLALGGVVLVIVSAAASLAGVRLLVRGLTGGLTAALEGRVWLAELGSGLAFLAGTVLLLVLVHAWVGRRALRGLKKHLGDAHPGDADA